MIDIITSLNNNNKEQILYGKIDEINNQIELNCLANTFQINDFCKKMVYSEPIDISVSDTNAHAYVVYTCRFYNYRMSFARSGVMTLFGHFEKLVKENEINKKYNNAIFSFVGLEKFFPLEKIDTKFDKNGGFSFVQDKPNVHKFNLNSIHCEIASDYSGLVSSTALYNLDVKQRKVIILNFNDLISQLEIDKIILRIKKYFEFLLGQEIKLYGIVYKNEQINDYCEGKVISSSILKNYTIIKGINDWPFRSEYEELFVGMNSWMQYYDKYVDVINIWEKTIYNQHITNEDRFIWYCQAFELLCTIEEDIYGEAAKLITNPKQQYPNLKDFLKATNKLFNIWDGLDEAYFKTVKDVRDKLIHNNPQKSITECQEYNSLQLIEMYFTKTLESKLGINGIPISVFLKS